MTFQLWDGWDSESNQKAKAASLGDEVTQGSPGWFVVTSIGQTLPLLPYRKE